MFDSKSDYALNKMDPEAIVYIDSEGTLVRLTLAKGRQVFGGL